MRQSILCFACFALGSMPLWGDLQDDSPAQELSTSLSEPSQSEGDGQQIGEEANFAQTDVNLEDERSEDLTYEDRSNGESWWTYDPYCCDECDDWDLWAFDNYVFLKHTGGHGLSYRRGYTSGGVFYTPPQLVESRFVPFVDLRGHIFDEGRGAANAGLGLRYIISDWNTVVGVNCYYDYRRFHRYSYNQIGVGFELLNEWVDFRVNGYIPVGDYNHRRGRLFAFGDDLFAVRFEWFQAFKGIDAEVGTWIIGKRPCNQFGLYFAIGPYFYSREHRRNTVDDSHHVIRGGRARLLAKLSDYIDISVTGTYDNFYHGTVQGQITLVLPFCDSGRRSSGIFNCCCAPSLPCLARQMAIQPVERNEIIVIDPDFTWQWNWPGACPCSYCSDEGSCPSSSSSCSSGQGSERHFHSSDFSSDFFPFPYNCSYCHSSAFSPISVSSSNPAYDASGSGSE